MKILSFRIAYVIALTITTHTLQAQDSYLINFRTRPIDWRFMSEYWRVYQSVDAEYNCRETAIQDVQAVNGPTFDTLLKPILSNVFFGSNDLVKSATATRSISGICL